jgi:vitamin B12/bleomycin/antimicrobial peptide transport system ATP-binding/permease protein
LPFLQLSLSDVPRNWATAEGLRLIIAFAKRPRVPGVRNIKFTKNDFVPAARTVATGKHWNQKFQPDVKNNGFSDWFSGFMDQKTDRGIDEPVADTLPGPDISELEEDTASDTDVESRKRRYLLKRFWLSARGFWGRAGGRLAWALPCTLIFIIVLNVAVQYGINVWNRAIFDGLEKHDSATVFFLMAIFIPLAATSVLLGVLGVYARMSTQRRWRAWLSDNIIDRWLKNGRYYQLNLVSGDHENPEYRIAEDLRVSTDAPVDFAAGVLTAGLSAATFVVVLWTIGGALTIPIGGTEITVPGFLVVAAVLYAIVASGSMVFIGRRFVKVSETKNQAEAEYRYALTRVRENGESIALLGGEEEERAGLDRSMRQVLREWRDLCLQHMRTTIVSLSSSLIAPVIPILLTAPKFLDGSMTLGQMMQAASAFTIVQAAFGWLVDNYPRLAEWNACARRIASLMVSLDALERAESGDGVGRIKRTETDEMALRLRDLSVSLDDGTAVLSETDVAIEPGERVLVAGESGTGKSTLVRAISGLWPWGGGTVEIRKGARLFMLPQRPYVPTGTLRRAAAYPAPEEDWTVEQVREALKQAGLEHFSERVEEEAPWDQTLSGGEKQRLAIARVLLHKPDILVLDEATSALDPANQDALMKKISDDLKGTTIISVGHRPELEAFHSRKIVLERRRGGARLVSDVHLIPNPGRNRLLGRLLRRRRGKTAKA